MRFYMNKDNKVIEDFGDEWVKFNYDEVNKEKIHENFKEYFRIFPWDLISKESIGFDMGCGSGRWSYFIAPKIKKLFCVEPSKAIEIAKINLKNYNNVIYLKETTEICSIKKESQDFGYSLGVLHHIPDTQSAINDCSTLLKKGAPFLVYLYYNFENKPIYFKFLWKLSDFIRRIICRFPKNIKIIICNLIAYFIYFPLSRLAFFSEKIGIDVQNFPLSYYRSKPFYQCKNDALDRFGTRLEQRFSKKEIKKMMIKGGFENIKFSTKPPFWCCVGTKK